MIISTLPIGIGSGSISCIFLSARFAGGYYLEIIRNRCASVAVPLDSAQMLALAGDLVACARSMEPGDDAQAEGQAAFAFETGGKP